MSDFRGTVYQQKKKQKIGNNKIPKHKIVTPANNDHTKFSSSPQSSKKKKDPHLI